MHEVIAQLEIGKYDVVGIMETRLKENQRWELILRYDLNTLNKL